MRDLVNQTLQNASTILDNLILDIQVEVVWESHDVIAKDCVIRTIPEKGEPLQPGQKVTLVVSSGPAVVPVEVPDLMGLSEERAIEKLNERSLYFELTYVESEKPAGTVVYQSIQQGEEVKRGTTINLQIAREADETEDEADETEPPINPSVLQTRLVDIHLPAVDEVMNVAVYMDGNWQDTFDVDPVTIVDNKCQMVLKGVGVHQIDVMIDGALSYSFSYDFDTGEVLW